MNWFAVNSPNPINLLSAVTSAVERAGSDNLDVFGGTWQGGYWIQQQPEELARLVCLLAAHGPFRSSLEIGIAAGGTTRLIRDMVSIDRTAVIDDGNHPQFKYWEGSKTHITNLSEFIGDSHSPGAGAFLDSLGTRFDLVGIDGDHSTEGIRTDWEMVQPLLLQGAIIWFHDIIAVATVRDFWNELKSQHHVLLETDGLGIGALRYA